MKKSKYSDAQIMSILKQAEGGVPVADLCCEHGITKGAASNCDRSTGASPHGLMHSLKALPTFTLCF